MKDKITIQDVADALKEASAHAIGWSKNAQTYCTSFFKCAVTGYNWPANAFALSLGSTMVCHPRADSEELYIPPSLVDELYRVLNYRKKFTCSSSPALNILSRVYAKIHYKDNTDGLPMGSEYYQEIDNGRGEQVAKAWDEARKQLLKDHEPTKVIWRSQ